MSFWTYLLRCADGSYYVGHSDNLELRIAQHQSGEIPGYTHDRRPLELVWSENFQTRDEAFAVERQLKGWSRTKKEELIGGDWDSVRSLAKRGVLRDAASTSSAAPQDERLCVDPAPQDDPSNATPAHPEEGPSEAEGPSRSGPIIILVRPQLGQNIGKTARAMLNFGLTEMRIVAPRDGWPNPDASAAASGADFVLERAQLFDSVADATADCTNVYATTVRRRGVTKPVLTPEQAALAIHREPGRSAILFGPERSGLESDDVALARTIITVPINPEFGSLNLAQAVILVAYEWSKSENLAQPPVTEIEPPAPQFELDGLVSHLETMLDKAGYFFPPDRTLVTKRMLRTLLTKPAWSAQEVRTLRGVLTAFEKPHPR